MAACLSPKWRHSTVTLITPLRQCDGILTYLSSSYLIMWGQWTKKTFLSPESIPQGKICDLQFSLEWGIKLCRWVNTFSRGRGEQSRPESKSRRRGWDVKGSNEGDGECDGECVRWVTERMHHSPEDSCQMSNPSLNLVEPGALRWWGCHLLLSTHAHTHLVVKNHYLFILSL